MSDYGTIIEERTVRFERLLPGPVERVWEYLTDSQKRGTWLATGEMDLRVGGKVEHVWRNNDLTENDDPAPEKYADIADEARMGGKITACDPPHLLSYTWEFGEGEPSEVMYELEARDDKVLLTLTHRRLASRGEMVGVGSGWHAHLEILAARLEGHEPDGFWRTHTRLEVEYEERIPTT